jgi:hypothetical protein
MTGRLAMTLEVALIIFQGGKKISSVFGCHKSLCIPHPLSRDHDGNSQKFRIKTKKFPLKLLIFELLELTIFFSVGLTA